MSRKAWSANVLFPERPGSRANPAVRVLIVRQPAGAVDGVPLAPYNVGKSYELPPTLANYLVAQGFAVFEDSDDKNRERQSVEPARTHRR